MSAKKRILFVSHSATRNGATILLLDLLRWLTKHSEYQLEALVNGRGELLEEFRALCRTTVCRNTDRVFAPVPSAFRSKLERWPLALQMLGRSYDLAYFNTASTALHMSVLSRHAINIVWHIHELEYALRKSMDGQLIQQLFPLATRFIVVSKSVRENLISKFEVSSDKIDLVHGFVSLTGASVAESQSLRKRIHDEFDWPRNAFVVGGCGALGWRKGSDLFLQIAEAVLKSDEDNRARFLWVGGGSADERLRFEHDIGSLGLQEYCRYVPSTSAVIDYYYAMNVFALTSREDPFPLVMLEAGSCNLPIVCFAGSGGGPEFVDDDIGFRVPYLDVAAFAKCLKILRNSPELCRRCGAIAAEKVRNQYTVDIQGPKVLEIIGRCLV